MKKLITVAVAALFALTAFVGCTQNVTFSAKDMPEAEVDLTTAKVGYGLTIKMDEEGKTPVTPLEIAADGYSQCMIELPYQGFTVAEVELSITGKTTVGFLGAGAMPWDGRMDGGDVYLDTPISEITKKKVAIPAGAAYITFGSNGEKDDIVIKSITIKTE